MAYNAFQSIAPSVAYVSVEDLTTGEPGIGSAFHVGSNVFITAKHVVDKKRILEVGTKQTHYVEDPAGGQIEGRANKKYRPVTLLGQPTRTEMSDVADVACLVVPGAEELPYAWLMELSDRWVDGAVTLDEVTVWGYPPVPFSREPVLLAVRAEVSGAFQKYTGGYPHFVVSSMARGGFSGGPVIHENGAILGLVTEALVRDPQHQPELGFMAVLHAQAIIDLLKAKELMPSVHKNRWDAYT